MNSFLSRTAAILFVTGVIATNSSCSKGSDNPPTCAAGAGGSTSIVLFATINGSPVINTQGGDTAYVKYGSTAFPGNNPSSFDTAYVGEEGENHIHLSNLKCGSYYILRTSYDTLRKRRFTGSTGISFTKTSGEIDTTLVLQ